MIWNMSVQLILIIVGEFGTIAKALRLNKLYIQGRYETEQPTALLDTKKNARYFMRLTV